MSDDLTKKLPKSKDEKLTLILNRLDSVEETLQQRLYDTRPIWQKRVADIAQLQGTVERMQEGFVTAVGEVKKTLRDVYYRCDVLNDTMLAIRADHRDVYDRLRALENAGNPPNTQT